MAASFLIFKGGKMASPRVATVMKQGKWTPWFYVLPALIIMTVFIVYPMINTVGLSFLNKDSSASAATTCVEGEACWGALENYRYALTNEINTSTPLTAWNTFWTSSYGNTIKWMVFMVAGTVIIGLVFAVLADKVKYEPLAKSIIFMPMAISFVGAGVIWKFMYNYGTSQVQIGVINAVITALGGKAIPFLSQPILNTFMLIIVGVWMRTGFCMTILSSAIKSIPEEVIEASRIDGATEWQVFMQIMVPIIAPTIVVVITTMVINTLKLFDIVYVMTGGNFGTDVIATRMYREMYSSYNTGRGTAIAVILIILIIPFIYMNIKRFIQQEAIR